jgi:bis(5'-adenosyl)-triphosphatase
MPLVLNKTIHFSKFVVNPQIFYITPLSYALVNLKPLIPGHVLVCPIRVVPRLSELSAAEVQDLFQAVQHVGRMIERVYKASSLNIAIQDGPAAGQSVPHLHAHIIPRSVKDLEHKGGSDAIYEMLEDSGAELAMQYRERSKFPKPDEAARKPRSDEDMRREAEWLSQEMDKQKELAHL